MTEDNKQTIIITMDREFGRLEARMDALEKRHKELEQRIENRLNSINRSLDSLDSSLDEITTLLNKTQGAAKMGGWVLAALAGLGAFVTWVLDVWNFTR